MMLTVAGSVRGIGDSPQRSLVDPAARVSRLGVGLEPSCSANPLNPVRSARHVSMTTRITWHEGGVSPRVPTHQ